jgi:2,4-dienoyl-CoA reductase-like NADH-dependent reductase (Old Yellow Enzyme family)
LPQSLHPHPSRKETVSNMSKLFTPLNLGSLPLSNRIIIAPMCQYSASNGNATGWHMMHLGQMAMSGAGLLILEATAVSPEGRISPQDLGLYSDENESALARVLAAVRQYSEMPVAVQLGHAGRKASSKAPWLGGQQILPGEPDGWQTVAPSAVAHNEGEHLPEALDETGIAKVVDDFVSAARRSARLGLDGIELHMAHGYLLHQFLSPLANRRNDQYGGSLEGRMRLPLEVFGAVRAAFPEDRPVWVRISASDWVDGGWDVEQSIELARQLEAAGCNAIHVSSGGVSPDQQITLGPGYQVGFAREIKEAVSMPVIAVGLITEPEQAEDVLTQGDADAIALARAMLYNPRWPWHAAASLGAQVSAPPQYWRSPPHGVRNLFADARFGQR